MKFFVCDFRKTCEILNTEQGILNVEVGCRISKPAQKSGVPTSTFKIPCSIFNIHSPLIVHSKLHTKSPLYATPSSRNHP
ncbi:MAG: hypothetical protein JWQ30_1484 [Sediminibacterium sp.]|nr:hypothetical protein [Sediminibacterium sp.]